MPKPFSFMNVVYLVGQNLANQRCCDEARIILMVFPDLQGCPNSVGFSEISFSMGYFFFFWSEHCSTTQPVLFLRLGTLLLFISAWPMRHSSDGSPSSGRLRMGVWSLMMVNLVFHCISFHSNQLRTTADQGLRSQSKNKLLGFFPQ